MAFDEQPNGVRVLLPWPDPILNPNKHVSYKAKMKPNQIAKTAAFYLAKQTGVVLNATKQYRVQLVFFPPDHQARDLDNLVSALKSALDGLSKGFGVNDRMFQPVPDWGPIIEHGKVEVTISEIDG